MVKEHFLKKINEAIIKNTTKYETLQTFNRRRGVQKYWKVHFISFGHLLMVWLNSEQQMERSLHMSKRITASIIAATILILALVVQLIGTVFTGEEAENEAMGLFASNEKLEEKVVERGSGSKRIVELNLEGAIIDNPGTNPNPFGGGGYQHDRFMNKLEAIKEDASIKGVHLYEIGRAHV